MYDIRFAHYRIFDFNSNRILSNGGVTLAVAKTDDGKYRIAGAKCHEIDHYCKKYGRVKAKGRLFCKHSYTLEKVIHNDTAKIVRKINWVELESKPDLEILSTIAESFYHNAKVAANCTLINSGVYNKQLAILAKQTKEELV